MLSIRLIITHGKDIEERRKRLNTPGPRVSEQHGNPAKIPAFLAKKLRIITANKKPALNRRTKLVSKCCHQNNFLLSGCAPMMTFITWVSPIDFWWSTTLLACYSLHDNIIVTSTSSCGRSFSTWKSYVVRRHFTLRSYHKTRSLSFCTAYFVTCTLSSNTEVFVDPIVLMVYKVLFWKIPEQNNSPCTVDFQADFCCQQR